MKLFLREAGLFEDDTVGGKLQKRGLAVLFMLCPVTVAFLYQFEGTQTDFPQQKLWTFYKR